MTERPTTLELLDQSEIWTDADGNTHQVADMEMRHARNVIRMLERSAKSLHSAESWSFVRGPVPSGDMACDAFDAAMDQFMDVDPLEWIHSTDLVQALYQRIGEPVPGQPADEDGPPDWLNEDLPEETPEFSRPVHRYSVVESDGAHCVAQRSGWQVTYILRYANPEAARDAADYLNTLTRWEVT